MIRSNFRIDHQILDRARVGITLVQSLGYGRAREYPRFLPIGDTHELQGQADIIQYLAPSIWSRRGQCLVAVYSANEHQSPSRSPLQRPPQCPLQPTPLPRSQKTTKPLLSLPCTGSSDLAPWRSLNSSTTSMTSGASLFSGPSSSSRLCICLLGPTPW